MEPNRAGKAGAGLERLELGLGIRVVVGGVGPAMTLGDPEVGEQERGRRGAHRAAPIGVDGERARSDALLGDRVGDEPLGEGGALGRGDHPARHVAAEDVEQDVQVEPGPRGGTLEFRDIRAPQLVRPRGQELGPGAGPSRRPDRRDQQAIAGRDICAGARGGNAAEQADAAEQSGVSG